MCGCEKIIFSTGTDEHGTKIQQSAAKSNVNLSDYCKNVSGKYSEMSKMFNIGYTDFIRTTEERHLKAVHEFWVWKENAVSMDTLMLNVSFYSLK